jgi:DNA-binding CsgD family transcriptional regulator
VDRVLAEEFGISLSLVTAIRNAKKIPPKRTIRHETVPDEIYNLLGKMSDQKIADRFGIRQRAVRAMRLKHKIRPGGNQPKERDPEMLAMFGNATIKEISEKFMISYERVRQLHLRRGIKPLKRYTKRKK